MVIQGNEHLKKQEMIMTTKEFFKSTDWYIVSYHAEVIPFGGKVVNLISVNEKYGSATIIDQIEVACHRCGGQGGYSGWPGYTCFRCGGNGVDPKPCKTKLYTQARAEKLATAKRKAQEKKEAEGRARFYAQKEAFAQILATNPALVELKAVIAGFWKEKEADESRNIPNRMLIADDILSTIWNRGRATERQLETLQGILIAHRAQEERRANQTHVGTVGQKTELNLTLKFERSFQTAYGITFIQSFDDQSGNCIVYKGSTPLRFELGETRLVRFTVKSHGQYNGTPQTLMLRPKILSE